ncbi:hypothetical protein HN51_031397 [Arachis hypogaea]
MDLLRHALFRSSSSAATASAAIVSAVKCGRIQVDGERVPVSYIVKSSQKISHFVHRHELPVMACEVPILQKELDVLTVCKPASVPEHHIRTGCSSVSVIVYGDLEKPALITYPDLALNYMSCFQGLFFCPEAAFLLLHNFCIYHISPPGHEEVSKLKAKYESLQRTQRHLLGEDLGPLSIKELQNLEKQLEGSLAQARQRKETPVLVQDSAKIKEAPPEFDT